MNKRIVLAAAAATALAAIPPRQKGKTVAAEPMPDDGLPDRLSIERSSRFYTSCGGHVGVRLDGEDVNGRVVEFCKSEGWARLVDPALSGKALSALEVKGAVRHNGVVETYWRMTPSRQIRRQLARIS